jgi:iron complex transport system substrate-binding protein
MNPLLSARHFAAVSACAVGLAAAQGAESPSAPSSTSSPASVPSVPTVPSVSPTPAAPVAPAAIAAPAATPVSATDDLRRHVELVRPARRIATLAPFLTELAFSAGAGSRVVAVSAWSDYPPEVRALPVVSGAGGISIESIAAVHPDLVLAWGDAMRQEDLTRLESLGIAVYVAAGRRLADVPRTLRAIGTLTALDVEPAANSFESRIVAQRTAHASRPPVDVFLVIGMQPLMTISGPHFMNEALITCGARNVFDGMRGVAPTISWETLYKRNPTMIVSVGAADSQAELVSQWRERTTLSAVRAGRLVLGDADRLQRPTLRTADGIEALCAAIDAKRPHA